MPDFPPIVERWRAAAQAEIARQRLPFPPELILSVIRAESGGDPKALSNKGAMGLMQVMPGTLKDYNQRTGHNYTDRQFKDSSDLQIKVGVWVLKNFWRSAYQYLKERTQNIAIDLLSKAASLFYVFGPGRARRYWNRTDPTYEAFASRYANTDPIKNGYATKIWDYAAGGPWNSDAVNRWLGGDTIDDGGTDDDTDNNQDDSQKNRAGAILAIGLMLFAWFYFKKKG
jgi:soluble lytic murein transglycosylase-like protein